MNPVRDKPDARTASLLDPRKRGQTGQVPRLNRGHVRDWREDGSQSRFLRTEKNIHRRRGTLMLQTLVTISLMMMIFGLIVGCMHQLLQADSMMRTSAAEGLIITRLESSFRRDCRFVSSVEVQDNACTLRFTRDHRVQYSAKDRVITREWTRGEESGIDHFRCSKGWRTAIEQNGAMVRLVLSREASQRTESSLGGKRQIVIEATIGIHTSEPANTEEVKQ